MELIPCPGPFALYAQVMRGIQRPKIAAAGSSVLFLPGYNSSSVLVNRLESEIPSLAAIDLTFRRISFRSESVIF